jgi:hypothetical protein
MNRILLAHDGIAGSRLRTPWHSHRWESCTLHISRNKLAFIRHTIHALAAHPYPYITTSRTPPPHPITQVLHYPHITPTLPPIPISQIPHPREPKQEKEKGRKEKESRSYIGNDRDAPHLPSPPYNRKNLVCFGEDGPYTTQLGYRKLVHRKIQQGNSGVGRRGACSGLDGVVWCGIM